MTHKLPTISFFLASAKMRAVLRKFIMVIMLLTLTPTFSYANPELGVPTIRLQTKAHILIDAKTNKILSQNNADERMQPASLTKIMQLYVVADQLQNGMINLDQQVKVSTKAWKTGGSRMFIEAGKLVSVEKLIEGVAIVSGNDSSITLAEHISGNEENFTVLMNSFADKFGLKNTNFSNSTGLPEENLYTTAHDMAILSKRLITDFPDFYQKYFSQRTFDFNRISQINRNKLLWTPDLNVDGIKTGRTDAAGYNLAVSAKNDNMRLIVILLGANSEKERLQEGEKLLRWGFRYFHDYHIYDPFESLTTNTVWMGETDTVNLGVTMPVNVVISKASNHQVNVRVHMKEYVKAPIVLGQQFGELVVYIGEEEYSRHPLVSLDNIKESGYFSQFFSWIWLHLHQTFN